MIDLGLVSDDTNLVARPDIDELEEVAMKVLNYLLATSHMIRMRGT